MDDSVVAQYEGVVVNYPQTGPGAPFLFTPFLNPEITNRNDPRDPGFLPLVRAPDRRDSRDPRAQKSPYQRVNQKHNPRDMIPKRPGSLTPYVDEVETGNFNFYSSSVLYDKEPVYIPRHQASGLWHIVRPSATKGLLPPTPTFPRSLGDRNASGKTPVDPTVFSMMKGGDLPHRAAHYEPPNAGRYAPKGPHPGITYYDQEEDPRGQGWSCLGDPEEFLPPKFRGKGY